MVNHATALNYHMYTYIFTALEWSSTLHRTADSGQIATVCRWEHIAVGKGFLLLLGSRRQIEEVPNLSSICAANYHVCQLETKYPQEAPVQIKSVHFSKLHLVQVHLDPAPGSGLTGSWHLAPGSGSGSCAPAQGCQPIRPPAQAIGNQSHPILPSMTI